MPLDPVAKKFFKEERSKQEKPIYLQNVIKARERMNAVFRKIDKDNIFYIEDFIIPCPQHELRIRLYRPDSTGELPILIYFHGGGWTVNNIETHDDFCRGISNKSKCVVISVDYRLSPEHKFPAALNDGYTTLVWAYDNAKMIFGNPQKIAVAGDSSGANLAASLCILARDRGNSLIKFQWLISPVTDYVFPGTHSYTTMSSGYNLDRNTMIWFWNNYLTSDCDINNPYICPLKSKSLDGLPEALILVAKYDPLCDEGVKYAEQLQKHSVPTLLKYYDDQMHGFLLRRKSIKNSQKIFNEVTSIVHDKLYSK